MKLFVAKLPPSVNSDRLKVIFEAYGEVITAKVIMDHDTGASKGYGFVEMGSEAAGQAAIQNLDGATMEGKEIVVKESEPQNNRPARPFGGGNRFGGDSGERRPYSGGNSRFGPDKPKSDRSNDRFGDRPRRRHDDDDSPRRRRF